MAIVEFPDLNKINFKTLMNGMVFNGINWVQFRNHFEHAIQVYVPLDLLTPGYFTGTADKGYIRCTRAQIGNDIALDDDRLGAYNIVFMKNLIHKLAISCFDYERYLHYETHKDDLTGYFVSDFNNGLRRRRHEWESVEDNPRTFLLDKTNFPEAMNVIYEAAHDGGKGQGNLTCADADGTSRQVSFRLWFDKTYITPKMIKEKQKDFNKMRFEPKYLLEINEASNFQTKFIRDLNLCQNNTSFLGGLQITLEEMLPQGRHDQEDYKSQMNLINNNITTTEQFFVALERVYDYYKSGRVGQYFREQFEKKQVHFNNKKEYHDNEKKKDNRFKKGDYGIVPLRNMKCYHCKRKGHLMSECRLKNKNRPNKDNKGKNYSKDKYSKDKKYKKEYSKGNGYTNRKGRK